MNLAKFILTSEKLKILNNRLVGKLASKIVKPSSQQVITCLINPNHTWNWESLGAVPYENKHLVQMLTEMLCEKIITILSPSTCIHCFTDYSCMRMLTEFRLEQLARISCIMLSPSTWI